MLLPFTIPNLGGVIVETEGFLISWHKAFYDDYDEQKGMQRRDGNEEMRLVGCFYLLVPEEKNIICIFK